VGTSDSAIMELTVTIDNKNITLDLKKLVSVKRKNIRIKVKK